MPAGTITSNNPTTAVAVTYDRWWFGIDSRPRVGSPKIVQCNLTKYGVGPDGKVYADPNTPMVSFLVDADVEGAADPTVVGAAFAAVAAAVEKLARNRNLIT